jgi:hypothetical protein
MTAPSACCTLRGVGTGGRPVEDGVAPNVSRTCSVTCTVNRVVSLSRARLQLYTAGYRRPMIFVSAAELLCVSGETSRARGL